MPKSNRLFPRHDGDKAWLYLLERNDGVVKVGMTRAPHARFGQHRTEARRRNTPVVRFHLFGAQHRLQIIQAEKRAVAALAAISQRIEQSEEFRGLTFAAALAAVRSSAGA